MLELCCVLGLVQPGALGWHPELTAAAATALALGSLVFIGVHVKYREGPPRSKPSLFRQKLHNYF